MKTRLLLFLFMLVASNLRLMAQTQATNLSSSLVGTWKMTTQTGIDQNGKSIVTDLTKLTQYKVINPTHWMFVAFDSDSQKGGGEGGTYTLKGDKYVETLDWAKTEYTVKVKGDEFYQDGFIIYPDGKKVELHEVYQRVAEPTNKNTDLVGSWNKVLSYDFKDGKKEPVTGLTTFEILTPSHFMSVTKKAGKMEAAMFGTYTREGNKIIPVPIIASFPVVNDQKIEINLTNLKADQLTITGRLLYPDGKMREWEDTFQRVGKAKQAKVASR